MYSHKKSDETPHPEIDVLVDGVTQAEACAISRAIQMVESRMDGSDLLLDALYAHVGKAHSISVTGPALPGPARAPSPISSSNASAPPTEPWASWPWVPPGVMKITPYLYIIFQSVFVPGSKKPEYWSNGVLRERANPITT